MVKMYGYEGKTWVCYFWRNNVAISCGISICKHDVEIHLPLGFIRIGLRNKKKSYLPAPGWCWGLDYIQWIKEFNNGYCNPRQQRRNNRG
jgi:hypothetical protein